MREGISGGSAQFWGGVLEVRQDRWNSGFGTCSETRQCSQCFSSKYRLIGGGRAFDENWNNDLWITLANARVGQGRKTKTTHAVRGIVLDMIENGWQRRIRGRPNALQNVKGRITFHFIGAIRFLFAGELARFGPQKLAGGKPRGFIKPACQGGPMAKRGGFPGKSDKDSLRDVLRLQRVAHVTHSYGVDEIYMTLHQFAEGGFRLALGIFPQQVAVFWIGHFLLLAAAGKMWTIISPSVHGTQMSCRFRQYAQKIANQGQGQRANFGVFYLLLCFWGVVIGSGVHRFFAEFLSG